MERCDPVVWMARSGWTWGLLLALTSITMPAPAQTAPEAGPATPAGTPTQQNAREKQLLERIRQLKAPRWRSYGVCRYDWTRWRLAEGGVRTTDVECGSSNSRNQIAVHCDTLQVARREGEGAWSPWRLPSSATESTTHGGEELMVAALCANLKPSETKPNAKPAAGSG